MEDFVPLQTGKDGRTSGYTYVKTRRNDSVRPVIHPTTHSEQAHPKCETPIVLPDLFKQMAMQCKKELELKSSQEHEKDRTSGKQQNPIVLDEEGEEEEEEEEEENKRQIHVKDKCITPPPQKITAATEFTHKTPKSSNIDGNKKGDEKHGENADTKRAHKEATKMIPKKKRTNTNDLNQLISPKKMMAILTIKNSSLEKKRLRAYKKALMDKKLGELIRACANCTCPSAPKSTCTPRLSQVPLTELPQEGELVSETISRLCILGKSCPQINEPLHKREAVHLNKPNCDFGERCTRMSDPLHRAQFHHPHEWDYLKPCAYGENCPLKSDQNHTKNYQHRKTPIYPVF